MKQLLFCILLVLLPCLPLQAQSNATQQAQVPGHQYPQWLVVRILQEARPALQPTTGMNLGQMIQAYRNGSVTIEYLCRDETDICRGVYRVSAEAGGIITISIEDTF
jgi:hypothetical protein